MDGTRGIGMRWVGPEAGSGRISRPQGRPTWFGRAALGPLVWALATTAQAAISISDTPLYLTVQVMPNVLINLSIESPMQGAAYNDQAGSVPGCTGRAASEGAPVTTSVAQSAAGTTSNVNAPTFEIEGWDSASHGITTVTVNGSALTAAGTYTGNCTSANDPASGGYKTKLTGSSLSLCFNNTSSRKNKPVTVDYQVAASAASPGSLAVGTCYFKTQTYLGYFDPAKCYDYDSANNRFEPVPAATASYVVGTGATCGGRWSGNFLNWAGMTAIDAFRGAMTGGHRATDSASTTVLERANQTLGKGHGWFPLKKIGSQVAPGFVAPGSVSPHTGASLYVHNHGVQFDVGGTTDTSTQTNLYARVKVCDATAGLEANCKTYGGGRKPVGLIQDNAEEMRFAVTSYLKDDSQARDGGVLRAQMKAVGPERFVAGLGWVGNVNREWSGTDGTLIASPDPVEAAASSVTNSGIINYINKFGSNGYKSHDPAGELFYESLRYFKHLAPTPEYSSGLTAAMKDGFPVIGTWNDPIQYSCQKNFIIGINDANPWLDKRLPGTYFSCDKAGTPGMPNAFAAGDCGEPSNPDAAVNVRTLTNVVGAFEGLNGVSWPTAGTWSSGSAGGANDTIGYVPGVETGKGSCSVAKTVANLGEVMGTCGHAPKENAYYIAGLAYYGNTHDLRADLAGRQSVTSFMIDTQEYQANPLDGPRNMLWLAGKYGGFTDSNHNDQPDLPGEWDADGDGVPDNYVFASQPGKLVNALSRAFTNILDRVSSASAIATNSTRLSTDTKVFQARFNSGNWSGQLRAYPLDSFGSVGALAWDAADLVPAHANRAIYTWNGSTGVSFTWAGIDDNDGDPATTSPGQAALNLNAGGSDDGLGSARLAWLRGDASADTAHGGGFRARPDTVLGDIINSDPVYVGVQNFAYENLGGDEGAAYPAFKIANASRTPMVYVGANDGMLHGFNASTGVELMAYVPRAVFPDLSKLTAPNYAHRYYVDGAPHAGEAYLSGAWRTVLVGGLNAGGKAVFALDITNPATFGAGGVMWEFIDTDLGYSFAQPQIARLENGAWAAIFGNGYDSTNQRAFLYVVDLATGTLLKKLDTGVGAAGSENGLSTPALMDTDGNRMVDTVYAGDLRGNVWKFDLAHTNPVQWDVAYKSGTTPVPLFTARNASAQVQPITAPLEVGAAPSGFGGYTVYFGTGSYFQATDNADTTVQSFYAIHDDGSPIAATDRSVLVAQDIGSEPATDPDNVANSGDERTWRLTSANAVDYASHRGWYLDLVTAGGPRGERVVSSPILRQGLVLFPTLVPGGDPCAFGGDSWLMALEAASGGAPRNAQFDTNLDELFDSADRIGNQHASALKSAAGIIKTPAVVKSGGVDYLVASGTSGDILSTPTPGTTQRPRTSWIQIQ